MFLITNFLASNALAYLGSTLIIPFSTLTTS
nr:MAG TPA: hypothetical protein [Caudoviricetes sp.]